jgi:FtsH-binding integral membrane protein
MLGIKLSFNFGIILFYLLFIIIIFDHLTYLFTSSYSLLLKILGIVGLLITSLYIIYDTNKILQDNYDGDFITASLNYYIDIFYYADFLTVGIRYLLYILNLFTAFVGINHIKKT